MEVINRKSFNIEDTGDPAQALKGYVSTSQAYEFKMNDGNSIVGTIKGVYPTYAKSNPDVEEYDKLVDYEVELYPVWTPEGPIDTTKKFKLSEVGMATQVFVRMSSRTPRKSKATGGETESWAFRFPGRDIMVTRGDFVKICYYKKGSKNSKDDRVSLYGYVRNVSNDTLTLKTAHMYNGLFSFGDEFIKLKDIFAAFIASAEFNVFDPDFKKKAQTKKDTEDQNESTGE